MPTFIRREKLTGSYKTGENSRNCGDCHLSGGLGHRLGGERKRLAKNDKGIQFQLDPEMKRGMRTRQPDGRGMRVNSGQLRQKGKKSVPKIAVGKKKQGKRMGVSRGIDKTPCCI